MIWRNAARSHIINNHTRHVNVMQRDPATAIYLHFSQLICYKIVIFGYILPDFWNSMVCSGISDHSKVAWCSFFWPWHAWFWRRPTVIPSGVFWQSTSWTVQPLASDQLILLSPSRKAKGLFKRSISASIPKSGGRGLLKPRRKAWRKTAWQTSQKIKDPLRRQTPSPDIQSLPLHVSN